MMTTAGDLLPLEAATWSAAGVRAAWSLLAASLGVLALVLGRRAIRAGVRRLPGRATAEKVVSAARLAQAFTWSWRGLCVIGVAVLISWIWGADPLTALERVLGQAAAARLLRLGGVAALGFVAFEVCGYLVRQAVARLTVRAGSRRRQLQLRTLGPLLQGAAQVSIAVVAVLMALGEIGVEIGPLLAGAGVVGIALGFGAQTLVKDILTGLFLVVEDIVAVGDIVRIGESSGLVEQMTLRTIRLRDFDGTLHVFPYGEAQVVHNLTKTFSYCVFNLQVSYGSDIDAALRLMKEVGEAMREDPAYAERILEPIEVVGVDNLADSGVVLKGRIKTKPLEQWTVGREYNRRIKLAFDAAGVEIPFPHMKVVLPERQVEELRRH